MELNEFVNLWKTENEFLKEKIQLNEKVISKMNLDSAIGTFKFIHNISLAGRNLAFVYFIISIIVAFKVLNEFYYSVPIIIGGLLMLWSFYHHLAIQKFKNFHNLSIIELQKSIEKFRIHTIKSKYYDFIIVLIWLLTLAPVYIKYKYNLDIYSSYQNPLFIGLILIGLSALLYFITQLSYNMYDSKLKNSESKLSEIIQFEQE